MLLKYKNEGTVDVFRGQNLRNMILMIYLEVKKQQTRADWCNSRWKCNKQDSNKVFTATITKKEDTSGIFAGYKQTRKVRLMCFEGKIQQTKYHWCI